MINKNEKYVLFFYFSSEMINFDKIKHLKRSDDMIFKLLLKFENQRHELFGVCERLFDQESYLYGPIKVRNIEELIFE